MAPADVLPQGAFENQLFSVVSQTEGVGMVLESTAVVWQVGDAGLTSLADPYYQDGNILSGSIAYVRYKDANATNGGQISEVKSFSMDTHAKTAGLYNIEATKVLTYTSQHGSHLMGAESYLLDIVGNWSYGGDDIVCVFAKADKEVVPAFCNKVAASSKLISVTTAQIEAGGGLIAVAHSPGTPAALHYEISVTPDAHAASGYATGIVSTMFTVSVMEGRSDGRITLGTPGSPELFDCFTGPGMCDALAGVYGKNAASIRFQYRRLIPGGPSSPGSPDTDDRMQILAPDGSILASWQYSGGSWNPSSISDPAYLTAVNPNALIGLPEWGGETYPGSGTFFLTMPASTFWTYRPAIPFIPVHLENYDQLASTMTHIDTATVAGGISTFTKAFDYQSGVACEHC